MLDSRPIQNIRCITQATLFNACLAEDDLRQLDLWDDQPNRLGFSSAVWCRAFLHRACNCDPLQARRVSDLLDLRYFDTLVLVRWMEQAELEEMVNLWVTRPDGQALPGLIWALCTDTRDEVHVLGARLCHEAATVAMRSLIETPSCTRSRQDDS